ncbi:rhomboid family intramembrane serine protease [Sphingomonas sp. HT-1]|uniref:rhomboid family intramembrane serine protease n=1 Tax=unclassified Sphingomonas TaxID=196159 RepID=UPI0002DE154F|nr:MULTISPECIES: rhomboid family intramembrane serine protease [unclassified Sphingomonas]KTF69219.1 rhomboid family intramembrane serine protease [Sphingomonas sp. WG]
MRSLSATTAIVAITVVVSLLVSVAPNTLEIQYLAGFLPARLTGGVAMPAAWTVPALLTPLSSTLIHAGFFHLGMNMLMLGYTGREAERALGGKGLITLYLIGAYAAAATQWLADPMSTAPMIGASGATSAVVGAYSLLFGRQRAKAIGPIPAPVVHIAWLAAAWIGLNLLMGFAFVQGGVDVAIWAHIGGFLVGLALARPLLLWRWRHA